jgi:hypothetical protein
MAKAYKAPEGFEAPELTYEYYKDGTWQEKENAYLARLADRAKMNGTSPLLGEVIKFQRGDGYALYMVWKTKPLELIWIQLGDAWSVEEPLIRGLRVADVQAMVDRERALRDLFATKRAEREATS